MKQIALYIHIPFCSSKCDYCDFYSFKPTSDDQKSQFEQALLEEITRKSQLLKDREISSIYIGGGTPSAMSGSFFMALKNKLDEVCKTQNEMEFTVEVNPSSFNNELAKTLKRIGVNRLSVGFQCANDRILKYIHRNQTLNQFENAMKTAKQYFDNISVDIMTGLPHESVKDVKFSIKKALKYKPKHISVYSLMVIENTPLFNMKQTLSFIPNEKQQVKMLDRANKMLERAGFERYEVSNYAKKAKDGKTFYSRHNLTYWNGGDYLGFGPSASSKIGNVRLTNEKNFNNYVQKNFIAEKETLSEEQIRLEKIMLGLRCMWGCDKNLCKQENLPFLIKNKYVIEKDGNIVATKKGINVLNIIIDKLT